MTTAISGTGPTGEQIGGSGATAAAGDGGGVGGLPVESDLAVWWDASDLSTITTSGSQVTLLEDKGPRGLDLAPRGTGPDSGVRTMNGLNVLDFVSGEFLEATIAADVISAPPVTIFAVAQWDSGTLGAIVSEGSTTDASARFALQASATPGNARVNTQAEQIDDGPLDTAPHLWTSSTRVSVGPQRSIGLDGANPVWVNASQPGATNRVALGAYPRASPAWYWDGAIAEVIIYAAALSAGDIATMEAHLMTKWGIAGSG